MNIEELKKEGQIDALGKAIWRKLEKVTRMTANPAGISPSDLDHAEKSLKECLELVDELKKLQ